MKFLPGSLHKSDMTLEVYHIDLIKRCIDEANRIVSHHLYIHGRGALDCGKEICWNMDYAGGFQWPRIFFKRIAYTPTPDHTDIKNPWELSRFQHLPVLGKAYRLTGDSKYPLEFAEQIRCWIRQNPVGYSVNWACTMEVSIRAINWIAGWFFLKEGICKQDDFYKYFYQSLYEHGCFIYTHLEKRLRNNHSIANLCALIWLGLFFREGYGGTIIQANTWLDAGINGFHREMSYQVYQEGFHYERSTYYHKYVTEMFLITAIVCRENGVFLSEAFTKSLLKMCEAVHALVKPDRLSDFIGDADDGRLLILSSYFERNSRDFRHVLAAAAGYFNREDFFCISAQQTEEHYFTSGKTFTGKPSQLPTCPSSIAYRKTGIYILRNSSFYCLVSCRPYTPAGLRGHIHNDILSFTLSAEGLDFIIDPGTCVYTYDPAVRNLFRGTSLHNTLFFINYEQNSLSTNTVFDMSEDANAEYISFSKNSFSGWHSGYLKKTGFTHERHFILEDDSLTLTDCLYGQALNDSEVCINFTLDPRVEVVIDRNTALLRRDTVVLCLRTDDQNELSLEEGRVSFAYGTSEKTCRIVLHNITASRPLRTHIQLLRTFGGMDYAKNFLAELPLLPAEPL